MRMRMRMRMELPCSPVGILFSEERVCFFLHYITSHPDLVERKSIWNEMKRKNSLLLPALRSANFISFHLRYLSFAMDGLRK